LLFPRTWKEVEQPPFSAVSPLSAPPMFGQVSLGTREPPVPLKNFLWLDPPSLNPPFVFFRTRLSRERRVSPSRLSFPRSFHPPIVLIDPSSPPTAMSQIPFLPFFLSETLCGFFFTMFVFSLLAVGGPLRILSPPKSRLQVEESKSFRLPSCSRSLFLQQQAAPKTIGFPGRTPFAAMVFHRPMKTIVVLPPITPMVSPHKLSSLSSRRPQNKFASRDCRGCPSFPPDVCHSHSPLQYSASRVTYPPFPRPGLVNLFPSTFPMSGLASGGSQTLAA